MAVEMAPFMGETEEEEVQSGGESTLSREEIQQKLGEQTDGKLALVETIDLPPEAELRSTLPLSGKDDMRPARLAARELALSLGMHANRAADFELAVGEALGNVLKHGINGEVHFYTVSESVIAVVQDSGDGIPESKLIRAILEAGYSTKSSLGMGFTMMVELVDHVQLATREGQGTTILLEKSISPSESKEQEVSPKTATPDIDQLFERY